MRDDVRRGCIVEVRLDPAIGHEASKKRPCVVLQNDVSNRNSPVTIVAAVMGAEHFIDFHPLHVPVPQGEGGLLKDSVIKCNQIRSVDEQRIGRTFGQLKPETMERVNAALRISLDL